MNSNIAVELAGITKYYKLYDSPKDRLKEAINPFTKKPLHKKFYALSNINLVVEKGEVLGIVGKNGAGKSTLLKIIAKVIQPSFGTLTVNGRISALLELGSDFNQDFTGLQNIYFYGSILGYSRNQMNEIANQVINFADIGEFIHQPIKSYSAGMKARLAFAAAINVDPDILIIDEVLSVGDTAFRRKCFAWIEGLIKQRKTIIFVSHTESNIIELCTRAAFIEKGEKIIEGEPTAIINYYTAFMHEKPDKSQQVLDKIKAGEINIGEQVKSDLETDVQPKDLSPKKRPTFIPGLTSKSKSTHRVKEVDYSDLEINTLSGESVNSLVFGDEYILSYKLHFKENIKDAVIGIRIKTLKGIIISGTRYPLEKDKYVKEIPGNSSHLVEWKFHCSLLPGDYVIDVGVTSFHSGEREVLFSVFDALLFKVQEELNENRWGIVSLKHDPVVKRLD